MEATQAIEHIRRSIRAAYAGGRTHDVVNVMGAIGAGKSTLLRALSPRDEIQGAAPLNVLLENVARYKEDGLLANYYQDQRRWAYLLQTVTFDDRVRNALRDYDIGERGIVSDAIFACENARRFMTPPEIRAYAERYVTQLELNAERLLPARFVYMQLSEETAWARITSRRDVAEATIDRGYIADIHAAHDEWVAFLADCGAEVLLIDAEADLASEKYATQLKAVRTYAFKGNRWSLRA